nr:MAG TPA: hypothetical protein [Herelleviridae sp.]
MGGTRTALLASISTVATPTRKVLAKSFLFLKLFDIGNFGYICVLNYK